MILQALKEYYDRKAAGGDTALAPPGFEWKAIPYVISLKADGLPISLACTYEGQGKERQAKQYLVPAAVKKTSGIASNLLWDNPEYVLGYVPAGKKPDRVAKQHTAFRERLADLGDGGDAGIRAVRCFLERPDKLALMERFGETWEGLAEEGANISFSFAGDPGLVSDRPAVREALERQAGGTSGASARTCLVTGLQDPPERLHAAVKGVWGAQTSGANIVSFNLTAFNSYGKKQGENAPVGTTAAFAYTTALNHLLAKGSRQRMQVGESSTVFWADRDAELETGLLDIFGEPPKDDPDRGVRAVESLYKSVASGAFASDGRSNRFYVLGLAPNAARIAIRFWHVDTVKGLSEKIVRHFEDLRVCHGPRERDVFSLFRLLVSIATQGKSENIPPNIAGDTMRAILEGLPYPRTLLQAAIRRIRADHEITYPRAALIKACINRQTRFDTPTIEEELKVSLETKNDNIGYRLGRLFSALERVQAEANPGINATIRDRFYGAASGTPVAVFSNLMRLKNHHLAKLENAGRRVNLERLIGEIVAGIDDFPTHLSLADQGRFAIGYYHQQQAFFTKKSDANTEPDETNEQ